MIEAQSAVIGAWDAIAAVLSTEDAPPGPIGMPPSAATSDNTEGMIHFLELRSGFVANIDHESRGHDQGE